jgi:hypothetical protein
MDKKKIVDAFSRKKHYRLALIPYDRAEWHVDEVRQRGLPALAAYIHSGMVLGWAVNNELISLSLNEKFAESIAKFRQNILSPSELFEAVGGVLEKSFFSTTAKEFLDAYYNRDYLKDYIVTVERGESDYHVEESKSNISKINALLDRKFSEFKEEQEQKINLERESSSNPLISETLSVFVVLGSPKKDPLWLHSEWPKYFAKLNPIVSQTRGRPHVDTIQLDGKMIAKMGRLVWDDDCQKKWTLQSSDLRKFYSLDISCPSGPVCLKEKLPPDFHLHVSNELIYYSNPFFNPTLTLVIRDSLKDSFEQPIEQSISELAAAMDALLVVRGERTFALPLPGGGLLNCLNDKAGLVFKGGNHHLEKPSINIFDESWARWAPFDWKKRQ